MNTSIRDRSKKEKIEERDRKIRQIRMRIADECVNINQISGELRKTETEEEAKLMKLCRRIEDGISSIRRKYKEIERLEYTEIE